MNDDADDLEILLRRWRPREVRGDLTRRVALDLECPPQPKPAWWQRLGFSHPWAAVGWGLAAPALIFLATLSFAPAGTTTANPLPQVVSRSADSVRKPLELQPTKVSNRHYETSDEGVVFTQERRPMRQTRYQSEDTIAWRDARTGTQLEVSYPREDVVQIPVIVH